VSEITSNAQNLPATSAGGTPASDISEGAIESEELDSMILGADPITASEQQLPLQRAKRKRDEQPNAVDLNNQEASNCSEDTDLIPSKRPKVRFMTFSAFGCFCLVRRRRENSHDPRA
jgi:hypothetical protein